MSADAFQWYRWADAVRERTDLRPASKLVADTFPRYADNRTGLCHPGEAVLARRCGLQERAVRFAISQLTSIGALAVLDRGRGSKTSEYRLVPLAGWPVGRPASRPTDDLTGTSVPNSGGLLGTNEQVYEAQTSRSNRHTCATKLLKGTTHRTASAVSTALEGPPPPPATEAPRAGAHAGTGAREASGQLRGDGQQTEDDLSEGNINGDGGGGGEGLEGNVNGERDGAGDSVLRGSGSPPSDNGASSGGDGSVSAAVKAGLAALKDAGSQVRERLPREER